MKLGLTPTKYALGLHRLRMIVSATLGVLLGFSLLFGALPWFLLGFEQGSVFTLFAGLAALTALPTFFLGRWFVQLLDHDYGIDWDDGVFCLIALIPCLLLFLLFMVLSALATVGAVTW